MARQRRGGFRPPELRGTLGTLLRTTLEQAGVVRDAISRGARSRFDEARSQRRRQDALASLGELVLDLIRRGEIDLAELPEARDIIQLIDDLDADAGPPDPNDRIAQPPTRGRFDARPPVQPRHDDDVDVNEARPPMQPRHDDDASEGDGYGYDRGHVEDDHDHPRSRAHRAATAGSSSRDSRPAIDGYDRDRPSAGLRAASSAGPRGRASAPRDDDGHDRSRASAPRDDDGHDRSRPSAPRDDDGHDRSRPSASRDDGTVSAIRDGDRSGPGSRSGRGASPKPASSQRVWRPSIPDAPDAPDAGPRAEPRAEPPPPRDARSAAQRPPPDLHRKGGIHFDGDDDEDLADYMHPDDVPPKPRDDDDR